MGGACSTQMSNAYKILVGKPEGNRPLRRPRNRWEYHIRMDLRETEWEGVELFNMTQDRDQWWALMNMEMNLLVP
jgi:hypothetical protein